MDRKLNTSATAGGAVTVARANFDGHLDRCTLCVQAVLCPAAEQLWRNVVVTALRQQAKNSSAETPGTGA